MILREPSCRACEAATSGDCGGHGHRVILWLPLSVTRQLPQSVIDELAGQAPGAP